MEIELLHFNKLDSTNKWAKEHTDQLDPNKFYAITAATQTAGYGRQNRSWISKSGNLHLTLFFHLPKESPLLPNLAQLICLSTVKVLHTHDINVKIKWPNDLIFKGKKLAGVLAETITFESTFGIALGIGMDVNTPVEADQPTTSLREINGQEWNLKSLQKEITSQFLEDLKMGFTTQKKEFEKHLAYLGEKISFHYGEKMIVGIIKELTEDGRLILELEDGSEKVFSSGEIR